MVFLWLNRRVLPLKDLRIDLLLFSMECILPIELLFEVQAVMIEVTVDWRFSDLTYFFGGLSTSLKRSLIESYSSSWVAAPVTMGEQA